MTVKKLASFLLTHYSSVHVQHHVVVVVETAVAAVAVEYLKYVMNLFFTS